MIAGSDQVRHRLQGALVGVLGKFRDQGAGLDGESLGALFDAVYAAISFQHREDLPERHFLIIALPEDGLYGQTLVRSSILERVDQRQRDLALAQIVTDGLAKRLLARGEIEDIV